MTFGEKLQELRKKGAMSQDTLAEKLEVSRQAVSKWERDEAMPETEKIVRIANLFGVSTDYLLLDTEPAAAQPDPQHTYSGSPSNQAFLSRAERFIRRHGYKVGFYYAGAGAFVNFLCLLFRWWWRSSITSMTGNITDFTNNSSFVPGFDAGDTMLNQFQNATQQMHSNASAFGNLFLIGLIPGTALLIFGAYVIVKGRKITQRVS